MISTTSINHLVDRIATRIRSNVHPILEDEDVSTLENHIDIAFPLLDTLLKITKTDEAVDEDIVSACCLLISEVLGFIRYAIEQERQWAIDFSAAFQEYLAETVFVPEVNELIIQRLLDILHQSDLVIIDGISEANQRLLEQTNQDNGESKPPLSELLEEMAGISDSPYDLYENLISQLHQIVPVDVQFVMIDEMLRTQSTLVHEAAVLMLLHPDKEVRTQVPHILSHSPNILTPTNLRRMIIIRNWLPHDERTCVDALIRFMRLKQVDCGTWPSATISKVIATGFDGVGAQSVLVLSSQDEKYHLTGLLLKENGGIKEPILFKPQTEEQTEQVIQEMSLEVPTLCLDESYLHAAIPHFLALNLEKGQPPSPLLLGFAEIYGVWDWRAEAINESATIHRLMDEIDDIYFSHDEIDSILENSKGWLSQSSFAQSWIEQDAHVDALLDKLAQNQKHENEDVEQASRALSEAICQQILTPRRDKWQSRLLWMALWAKSSANIDAPKWQDFFILAKLLHDGVPLDVIPLMQAISEETVVCALA